MATLRRLCVALLPAILFVVASPAQELDPVQGQMVLHLLDYVSVEYPGLVKGGKVMDAREYAKQLQFSAEVAQAVSSFPESPEKDSLLAASESVAKLISAKADSAKVVQGSRELQRGLIKAYRIMIAPARAPDLSKATTLYQSNCSVCHGVAGDGNGPQATAFQPKPTNFRNRARQAERSIYGLYHAISLGVEGTSMPAFGTLRADERWALAFYVSQFVSTDEERDQGRQLWDRPGMRPLFPRLSDLVGATPSETLRVGESAYQVLAYLRARPEMIPSHDSASPYSIASARIRESLALYREGNREGALEAATSAYLDGYELAETRLHKLDHGLRNRIKRDMMAFRDLISSAAPVQYVEQNAFTLSKSIEEAAALGSREELSAAGAFGSSFMVVAREGLEAVFLLAAIAACLFRASGQKGLNYLHTGWFSALLLGVATLIATTTLFEINGAQREVTGGLIALLLAAALIWIVYWLRRRLDELSGELPIRGQSGNVLSQIALFGVALVSFLAVYRAIFEAVPVTQNLWIESEGVSRGGLIAGVTTAGATLAIIAWLVLRLGAKFPVRLLFNISSLYLAMLAVLFAGKGVAALQTAGRLPLDRLALSGIPALGIYPSVQGLTLQALLVVVILAGFIYVRFNVRRGFS